VYVDISLDRPRKLRFDLAAYRALEEAMDGKPIGLIIAQLPQFGVTTIGLVLWAGLRHESPKMTRNEANRIVDTYIENGGDMMVLIRALNEAIDESKLFKNTNLEGNAPPEATAE
jgi:hypothetical protein